MKLSKSIIFTAALLMLPVAAMAGERTVTLKVEGMTCASCPYQVQSALRGVSGVKSAEASLATRTAVVTYDDAVTNVAALTKATTDVGFPSALFEDGAAQTQ